MRNIAPAPVRPTTLEIGNRYLFLGNQDDCHPVSWELVSFISYTPCPAVVIVATIGGKRMRIAREELFEREDRSQRAS